MYEGFVADLQMERVISADGIFDEGTHHCRVLRYEEDGDYIRLQLEGEDLSVISLDAKYRCYIKTKRESLLCTGVIYKRFRSGDINIIIFRIENGFYHVPGIKKSVKRT
ncbi:MAG: hypothetical protein FWE25_00555 [Lachnospiraceae bacterium]|nr:hypothetical protein [Lachnospiraceae bacterium]